MKHPTLLLASVLVAAAEGLSKTGNVSCPGDYVLLGAACYLVSQDPHGGASAEQFCQGHGGHAAVIETAEEMDLLTESLLDRTVYLGVTARGSRERLFECSLRLDGHSGYTNFHTGEPNNEGGQDCVVAESGFDFAWEDVQCTQAHHVLCKTEATVTPTPPSCPDGAQLFQASTCFWVNSTQAHTWQDAMSACAARGMQLASVHSKEEQDFIRGLGYSYDGFWIGFHDQVKEGDFIWSDGTAVDYTNWDYNLGEPDGGVTENCCYLNRAHNAQWADNRCSTTYGVVCRGVPH